MKAAMFAAALLIGSAAIAQDDAKMQTDTTAMPSGQTVAPGNTAGRVIGSTSAAITRDATPAGESALGDVIADSQLEATAPAGFNQQAGMGGPMVDASQRPAMQPATGEYPACSRTVTDNCVQAYEVGSRRKRR